MKKLSIIVLLTALAYTNIFLNGPVIDDHIFVGKYHPSISEAFAGAVPPGHEGVYRPIRGLFYSLYGSNPATYHLNSLVVHILSTVLVFLIISVIARSIRRSNPVSGSPRSARDDREGMLPFIAALLFGLHPIHTESITYIASGMDSIGIVFFLASFYLYLKDKFWISLLFAIFAFFTTEMTLTLPLLILLYESVFGVRSVISTTLSFRAAPVIPTRFAGASARRAERTREWRDLLSSKDPSTSLRSARDDNRVGMTEVVRMTRKIWPYFGILFFYIGVRFWGLGITSRGPYLANSFYLTMLSVSKVLIHYIWSLIWPVKLISNHIISTGIEAFVYRGYRTAAIASQSILDPEILFSIGLIGLICLIGLKLVKKHPLISFGIGWFFISLLPVMEIVPQGSMMNEKFLYIPSIGFVMVASFLFVKLAKFDQLDKWAMIGLMGIALFYGVRTYARNRDWRDDIAVWSSDVRLEPTENAYARFALGNAYNDRKEYEKAVEQYQKSVEINPGFAVGYASLSRTYRDMGEIELSNLNYQKAESAEPGFWSRP